MLHCSNPNCYPPFFDLYRNNVNLLNSNAAIYDRVEETGCSVNEKFAFILHGWRQNCDKTDWVTQLRESKYIFYSNYFRLNQCNNQRITLPEVHWTNKTTCIQILLIGKIDFAQLRKLLGESLWNFYWIFI